MAVPMAPPTGSGIMPGRSPYESPAATGTERPGSRLVCSLASTARMPSEPSPPARGHEQVVDVFDGRLRVQCQDGALELLGADGLGHALRDTSSRASPTLSLAAPDVDVAGPHHRADRLVSHDQA